MQRSILHALLTLAPTLLFAQGDSSPAPSSCWNVRTLNTAVGSHRPPAGTTDERAAAVLWSEDFENGLGAWTVNTQTGAVTWQLTSTGNTGGYTPGPLQSTTGYPGGSWVVADSDLQGTAGVAENSTLTSPPITGLDTVPFMLLRFEQSFRQLNNDITQVEVSADGGVNWTVFPVNGEVPGNQSTPGAPVAQTVLLNISDALNGGSGDIRIRFHWLSLEGFTYSWQVDDIALLTVEANDLRMLSATYADWSPDEPDFNGLPYTIYPVDEVRELKFKALVVNNGSQAQTNVRLRADIDGPGTNNTVLYSAPVVLQPGQMDSLYITGYTPVATPGTFLLNLEVVQDQAEDLPDDNARTLRFDVGTDRFARDEDAMQGDRDNGGEAYELGNWYHIRSTKTLYAIDVALSARTDPGTLLTASVYDEDLGLLMGALEHEVLASELNLQGEHGFITLPLIAPVELEDGRDYFVSMGHYGGNEELWVATSGTSAPQSSLILDGGSGQWFYVTVTPMVRMNFDPAAALDERTLGGTRPTALPTVFDESTLVRYELERAAPVRWELRDALGRLVRQGDEGTRPAGMHGIVVDGAGLAPGVHLFTLIDGERRSVIRIVRNGAR
ncbi:MAG: hypothetical protein IT228_04900 [Flavobacteriales bacterium]|nr:hypothetical protein [Flavobacteriales bacterium]MCC6576662.1 hypothetical protein [Flavobacteriales bacterium]NUQ15142.1 hypothetical protein [Flavobacteriales bacterium]